MPLTDTAHTLLTAIMPSWKTRIHKPLSEDDFVMIGGPDKPKHPEPAARPARAAPLPPGSKIAAIDVARPDHLMESWDLMDLPKSMKYEHRIDGAIPVDKRHLVRVVKIGDWYYVVRKLPVNPRASEYSEESNYMSWFVHDYSDNLTEACWVADKVLKMN